MNSMKKKNQNQLSKAKLSRAPLYFNYLMTLEFDENTTISNKTIADSLDLNIEVVKKDFSLFCPNSNPRTKRKVVDLIDSLKEIMGLNNVQNTILIGVGHLGKALLNYSGFKNYGMKIVAAFDVDYRLFEVDVNGINIYPIEKLEKFIKDNKIETAMICVPNTRSQEIADLLCDAGIKGILNFTSSHIKTNKDVVVQSLNMASSFVLLYNQLNLKKGE